MVQVFGNRILGGIGAPESRAGEAFGAGVSTALGQRETRQAMGIREQEMAWKAEDREEAKRRRAAAEAAANAARARSAAMATRYREIFGAPSAQPPIAGLNVPSGTTAPSAAPAAPTRPAGVRPPTSPPLSFGTTITGGGGAATVGGGAGTDVLRGGEGVDQLNAPAPVYRAPRAPDRSGGTSGTTYDMGPAFGGVRTFLGTTVNVGPTGEITTTPPAAAPAAPAAPAGAGAPPEVAVTLPGGEQLMLSTGQPQGVVPGMPVAPAQLTFGPQLGAMPQTQEDVFVDNLLAQTGVTLDTTPEAVVLPPPMGEPGAPNRAVTRLLSERERQLQLAQAALEFNDMQTYEAAAAKIMELDVALEAGVARMAINEARYSNAPQRLNAIWTDLTGMQYEFVPAAPGVYDTYINGELFQQNVPVETIAEETLMMADANYAQQQAALAQTRAEALAKGMGEAEANVFEYSQKAAIDAQKALTVGLTEIDLLAMKRDLGIGVEDQIDFQKDDTTGMILVFRNGAPAGQYAPVTEPDATGNPVTRYQRVQ